MTPEAFADAFHTEPNAIKCDEIAARRLHALKQHYTDRLRLPEIKEMFEQMKDRAQVRQAADLVIHY